jgi:hypothetical protein
MKDVASLPLNDIWKRRLDLNGRDAPEFYENADAVRNSPHAGAIRATLAGLGASAVFCVQGVPTIVLLNAEQYERDKVVSLHAALWNQGLASLLLVLTGNTVRAFSLSRTPYANPGDEFERRCLIETLDATANALALKNVVYGAESGRFWEEHTAFFRPKERVDQVLLENLTNSHDLLCKSGLDSGAAQALLIQAMFIAYLEDREIIGEDYFRSASNSRAESFSALLSTGNVSFLKQLFATLRSDFNGDLFVAPSSFEPHANTTNISRDYLSILARFRAGQEEMAAGQLRFWGYNFKHIPIELISAVYDRFLGEREAERREHGAYYTPMFLADCVVSQVWETLSVDAKEKGEFLDPACGSGVFLVRSFQRLCENWREKHNARTIRWDSLKNILLRLHGWDLNSGAVRVAVFSLYIALLEQVDPPDIRQLIKKGKVLPELWGKTLKHQDFFDVEPSDALVDVLIGNPPWTSRRGLDRSSAQWCTAHNLPMPGKEDAWAFTWKSMLHLRGDGVVAFLLPAMGFLHNHSDISVAARNRLIVSTQIKRVVNFADLRFQLFEGALRPAALIIFGKAGADKPPYRFEYWAPKADLNLKVKRLITLSSADRSFVTSKAAIADPLVFKRRLWMSEPDAKLFSYLEELPKIGDFISDYGGQSRTSGSNADSWMIGQGYQPYNAHSGSSYQMSNYVGHLPNLPIGAFTLLAQTVHGLTPWHSSRVRRKGFERGFEQGARILIPRGVAQSRLRAAYVEKPLTFQHIIQAIALPAGQEARAKILTALLNSKVAIWYAFHGTASYGSDRPEVQQAELMRLPFPDIVDLPEPERARNASKSLLTIVESAMATARKGFALASENDNILTKLDEYSYEYFCLSPEEITLIEDAVQFILPAVQPHQGSFPEIWKTTTESKRKLYAETLDHALKPWFKEDQAVNIQLEAHNADLAVIRLTLCAQRDKTAYKERNDGAVRELLAKLFEHIHQPLPGNFQLLPDFRIFDGKHLYLVKPMQHRFWLRATALADAGAIALDLQDYVGSHKSWGRT